MKKILIFLTLVLCSCNTQLIKEFTFETSTIKLYEDNTFKREIRLLERKIIQEGEWSGSLEEGEEFVLEVKNAIKIKKEPILILVYTIKDGRAIKDL